MRPHSMMSEAQALHPVAGRILLLGADGMLGRAWQEMLEARGLEHAISTYPPIDLTDPEDVGLAVTGAFRTVVNCTGWTDVDGAEAHEEAATRINGGAVALLARRCADLGTTLVHYGTDYVFDGRGSRPYPTDHPCEPVNAYGRSKLAGEQALRASGARHLLVRTSWLYAPWAKNFVRTIAAAARQRDVLTVVDDQRGRPTEARHLAQTTLALLEREATGTFHVTDGGEATWFDLASEVVRLTSAPCRVEPCKTSDMPRPAPRPSYSVLDIAATEATLGESLPRWQDNVARALADDQPA